MSFWSSIFSKKGQDSCKDAERKIETPVNSSAIEETTTTDISYDQFDKQPGLSISLLNNDPVWNRFIHFESKNEQEIVAKFKRKELEDYVLNSAFQKGIIKFKTIENSGGYNLNISVSNAITTYSRWALKNEPIIIINVSLLRPKSQVGRNRCVYEYKHVVRSPFAGHLDTYSSKHEGGRLYQLCTAQRTMELWPNMLSHQLYDDISNNSVVEMFFNEYMYDENFWDGIPSWDWEAEGKSPCIRYEWKADSLSIVKKGQHICSIIKNPYGYKRKEYKIYSPVSGIIVIGKNAGNKEYSYRTEMEINYLFSIYKDKHSLLYWHYNLGNDAKTNKDIFDGTVSLEWDKVAGRELPCSKDDYFEEGYRGFEMCSDTGQYIVVSLRVKSNVPYIVFSVNSRSIHLSNGDTVELLFENNYAERKVLTFPITRDIIDESLKGIYDVSFFCKLYDSDIECMRENNCVSWRIKFDKQPLVSVVGYNASSWCPREYAGDVFREYVEDYMYLIEKLKAEYPIEFATSLTDINTPIADESCFVYLMCDTSNGYFKIGISNNPEYRERTLQSEKPTIEKVCAKEFPNRAIASAIESALHKTYESKRIRGEWFALDADDVKAISGTLY